MNNNFSKRRFYLNKKENANNSAINNENKTLEFHSLNNINYNYRFKKIVEFENKDNKNIKEKNTKTILFSNEYNMINDRKEFYQKNLNYLTFASPNKPLFNQNDIINERKISRKINQETNIYTKNKPLHFENIKEKSKNCFQEIKIEHKNEIKKYYTKNNNISNNILSSARKNILSNYKNESFGYNARIHLISFYNKKREIIIIQSIWRGYYFRKISIGHIKKYLGLISLNNNIKKIYKKEIKALYIELILLLKKFINYKEESYKLKIFNVKSKNNIRNYYFTNKKKLNTSNCSKYRNKFSPYYFNINNIKNALTNENFEKNKKKTRINMIYDSTKKRNEKKEILNDDDDDIFQEPIKILYISKNINENLNGNNRYYYKKRMTKIKKMKLEAFVKFLQRKFLRDYFTIYKNRWIIYKERYFNKNSIINIIFIIDSILKKYKKKYFNIYREKILDKKIKEEISKRTLTASYKDKNKTILFRNKRFLPENTKKINYSHYNINKNYEKNNNMFLETNIYNNIIFENYYESENEEQFIKKIYLKKNKQNYFKILNKIVFKKIEQQNKNDFLILNKYFKKWFNLTKSFNKEYNQKTIIRNLQSPDMIIRGNKKKKYIKIKYGKALTSKASISSIKSEERQNISNNFSIKQMRIRNIIINTNSNNLQISSDNYRTKRIYNNKINIKLSDIIIKVNNKKMNKKYFQLWKKNNKKK